MAIGVLQGGMGYRAGLGFRAVAGGVLGRHEVHETTLYYSMTHGTLLYYSKTHGTPLYYSMTHGTPLYYISVLPE